MELAEARFRSLETVPPSLQRFPVAMHDLDEISPRPPGLCAEKGIQPLRMRRVVAPRLMDLLVKRHALTDQGRNDRRTGLLGAANQCLQPSRRENDIVLDKGDVLRADARQTEVARLVRREEMLASQ